MDEHMERMVENFERISAQVDTYQKLVSELIKATDDPLVLALISKHLKGHE